MRRPRRGDDHRLPGRPRGLGRRHRPVGPAGPARGRPTFEVELWDGSGTVRLVFLGRRTVRGLVAGRTLLATGRLTKRDGRMTIFNPRYEIIAA